jgi:hypothetical protein
LRFKQVTDPILSQALSFPNFEDRAEIRSVEIHSAGLSLILT